MLIGAACKFWVLEGRTVYHTSIKVLASTPYRLLVTVKNTAPLGYMRMCRVVIWWKIHPVVSDRCFGNKDVDGQ